MTDLSWVRERYGDWRELRETDPSETTEERIAAQYWRTVAEVADTEPPASFYDDAVPGGDWIERQCDNTQTAMLNDYLWNGDGS